MLNLHNISIIWVQGFLILIENVLWLKVKTLTITNQECTLVN